MSDVPVKTTSPAPICSCGATARHPTDVDRCERGHVVTGNKVGAGTTFPPGNQARRTHGARSFETRGPATLPAELRQTVEEFRDAIIRDRGGLSELTTLQAGYIRRLSELETVSRLLAADLAQRGLLSARGRVRSTFSRWLETLDRWDRYATRVGVERKARAVTLAERLAQAPSLMPEKEPTTECE